MMMKSSFVDDGFLSQSCNLGQEIMLFYVSACFLLSAGCAERIVQFMSMAHTSKINHKILIVAHKSSSQHGKSIKRKSKKYAASPKKKTSIL